MVINVPADAHSFRSVNLKTQLFVDITNTVSIVKGFKSRNRQIIAANLLHSPHLLAQRLGSVERENLFVTSMQEIMCESTAETLIQLRLKLEIARTRRSPYIFRTTGKMASSF